MDKDDKRWVLEEPLYKVMLKIGLPIATMQVLNVVYNIVDLYWLGRYSTAAIAAINSSWPTFFLIVSAFMGLYGAGNSLISQAWGAGRYEYAVKVTCQLVSLSIIGGLPLALVAFLISPYLLGFIASDIEVYVNAVNYISIISLGIPIWGIFGSIQSAYISIGKSSVILRFVIVSNILNLILDPIFIFGLFGLPEMGAAGAALATVISHTLAMVLGFIYFSREGLYGYRYSWGYFKPRVDIYLKILRIGLPLSGSSLAEASGFYVLAGIIGLMGTKALSSWGVGDRPFSVISIVVAGLITACTTIVGQSIGAQDYQRAKLVVRNVLLLMISVTIAIVLPMIIFRYQIAMFFSPIDNEVVYYASEFILYMGPSLITLVMLETARAVASGSGHTKPLMILSMLRLWVLRNLLSFLLGPGPLNLGIRGLWIGMALSNVITGLTALFWIHMGKWLKPVIDYS